MANIYVYAHGTCTHKSENGTGGWGVFFSLPGRKERLLSGYELDTDLHKMGLKAVIEGLSKIKDSIHYDYFIYTDSIYVLSAINDRDKGLVGTENKEMIRELYTLIDSFKNSSLSFESILYSADDCEDYYEYYDNLENDDYLAAESLATVAMNTLTCRDESYP